MGKQIGEIRKRKYLPFEESSTPLSPPTSSRKTLKIEKEEVTNG
jgi:hypothetical protein